MKKLQGWNRFTPIKSKISLQLIKATTDSRLETIARRMLILETAIKKMNNSNGMFLNKPAPILYTISQIKTIQTQLLNK